MVSWGGRCQKAQVTQAYEIVLITQFIHPLLQQQDICAEFIPSCAQLTWDKDV